MACYRIILKFVCTIVVTTSAFVAPIQKKDDDVMTTVEFLMPNVQPEVNDEFLCYSMKVNGAMHITGFQPKAGTTIHHMNVYGCEEPGTMEPVWDCGVMHPMSLFFQNDPACKDRANIIYAWTSGVPEFDLPEGVDFKVGDNSDIKYLVLEVHYLDVSSFLPPENGTDNSGVVLLTASKPQPKSAGVYLLETFGEIPPHSTTFMEIACLYNGPIIMHPFAFRTHTHARGTVVSGYRVRDSKWTEIGSKNPQLPQMFYNVTDPDMTIEPGDILTARCTMVNNESRTIPIGDTLLDEMCKFFMMFYVDGDDIVQDKYCSSVGPPTWSWMDMEGLNPEDFPK